MLTTVIITKDEEKNIRRCLESVKWASEIIIVDSGSSDNTVNICREYTDKIFVIDWLGYGQTKNFGIEKATKGWILSLDADETVSDDLRMEITEKISSNDDGFSGYQIPRRLYFLGKRLDHGGCYPDYQLRLFRKDLGLFSSDPVHEKIDLDGPAGYLTNPIEHYSYDSIYGYFERLNRYTELDVVKWEKQGRRAGLLCCLRFPLEFFHRYIIRRGFLDGYQGLFYALFSSFSSFVKCAKLWEKKGKK